MANKKDQLRSEEAFEFDITHQDIVDMMNDPQVLIDGGHVSDSQEFHLFLKKNSGQEMFLKIMKATDTLVIRFKKVEIVQDTVDFTGIDVV
jgi:hypothetical protein